MTSMPGLGIVTRTETLLKGGFALLTGHNLLSIAVIEHADQKQLEGKKVSLAYTQDHHLSLREGTGTQQEPRQEPLRTAAHWLVLPHPQVPFPQWLAQLLS